MCRYTYLKISYVQKHKGVDIHGYPYHFKPLANHFQATCRMDIHRYPMDISDILCCMKLSGITYIEYVQTHVLTSAHASGLISIRSYRFDLRGPDFNFDSMLIR